MISQENGTKPNTTLRTSVTGIVAGCVTLGTVLYTLATGRHLSTDQIALLALLPAAVSGIIGNIGTILGDRATQRVANATADHVEEATGNLRAARKIAEAPKGGA